jgi:Tol biopolymer transport system component
MYEMLTGKKAFAGKSQATLIAAIMSGEPASIAVDQPLVPPALERIVRKCLAKDPEARWQTAHDLHDELRWIADAISQAGVPSQRPRNLHPRWPWAIVAATLTVATVTSLGWWRATRSIEQPLIQLDVDLGSDVALAAEGLAGSSTVIISPDGTRLVYAARALGGPTRLFTRRLNQPRAAELAGTEQGTSPFFSPDGQWVGFRQRGRVSKISVDGGAVVPLMSDVLVPFNGASWGRDGRIIIGTRGLVGIPDSGGPPTRVTGLASEELFDLRPQLLPRGKAVLFTATTSAPPRVDIASIEVVTLADQHRKMLLRGGGSGRYLPSGHLVYGNEGTLFAIPFDIDRLETHGRAVPVLEGVAYNQGGFPEFDVSEGGTLIYRRSGSGGAINLSTLHWLDGAGRRTPLRDTPGEYEWPRFSPDGQRLALDVTEQGNRDVWIYEWQRDTMTRLTIGANPGAPTWSPDGRYVIFSRGVLGGLFWTRADGSGQPQPLTQSRNFQVSPSFTPDHKWLAYCEQRGLLAQIWTVPVEDRAGQLRAGTPELFLEMPNVMGFATVSFSPDGRWLAYDSTESGRTEVYVRAFPVPASGPGAKWQISNAGGVFPIWSRTGRELFYQSGDQMMAVSYTARDDSFVAEKPRVWVAKLGGVALDRTRSRAFDLAPDGKRLAVLTPVEPVQAPKVDHDVVVVLNFLDELRRRVPVAK